MTVFCPEIALVLIFQSIKGEKKLKNDLCFRKKFQKFSLLTFEGNK